ncbi:MAG: TonB family protein [Gammaproteobacteria bacterium]|nr:TonB family protein [Gammaproteobacteria bacterium]MDH5652780.1 TonB family protein [Gammaproteobacteria bacterium]
MSTLSYDYLALDWSPVSKRDHTFNLIAIVVISTMMALGLIFSSIDVPKPERTARTVVPPRVATFLANKPKPKPKPKPIEKPKPPPPKPRVVREKPADRPKLTTAQQKIQDKIKTKMNRQFAMLEDLMNTNASDVVGAKIKNTRPSATQAAKADTNALTSNTTAGSGGVSADKYVTNVEGTNLAQGPRTVVSSDVITGSGPKGKQNRAGSEFRREDEVALTMERYKSRLNDAFRRAARRDPGLKGRIVFLITISPSGEVTKVTIKSSELNNPALEANLVARIKTFKFTAGSVKEVTVTYPIEFVTS